ncbi:metallophosphoesterase [Lapidilactobacillus wuchangensis]|uniref:metallophosphoesterase n=1 Tax=Lapidilactobacillus wuchangensis TaxID=2486001 RepID=UPI000F7AC030|nr:metallophosphoesterase [Lapidilactobacillus wuchangensis]
MRNLTFIGDIHSAAADLTALLADPVIAASQIVFLGDYIDGLSERKFTNHIEHCSVEPLRTLAIIRNRVMNHHDVALLGNHDDFWVQTAMKNDHDFRMWAANGGQATWPELGIEQSDLISVARALNQPPLQEYTDFLSQLPLTWQNETIFAVHAGLHWHDNLKQQSRDDLIWIRDDYYFADGQRPSTWHTNDLGKVLVTGHTPVQTLVGCGYGYLEMKASIHDVPRYLIDSGSRSGAYDGGIFALTLTPTGTEVQLKRAIKEKLYDGNQFITEAEVADQY